MVKEFMRYLRRKVSKMSTMGRYCKAYLLKNLREFNQWYKYAKEIKQEKKLVDGKEVEIERNLTEDDVLYLQENYVVTGGIFKDENIIFEYVTSEWKDFCTEILNFEIPAYETIDVSK